MPFIFPPFPFSPYRMPVHKTQSENTTKNRIVDSGSNNTTSNLFSFLPSSIGPLRIISDGFTNKNVPVFELFGIFLFLDDIIIICILIFLYQEHVTDQMLFVVLFLLLFS